MNPLRLKIHEGIFYARNSDTKAYDARATIMWASSMALSGFQLMLGKPMFPFPLHGIGHELSSLYDLTHGVTLALLTPAWMRHTMSAAPEYLPLFARFSRNVFEIREEDDAGAAVQSEYSVWWRRPEDGLLATLQELGIGLVDYRSRGTVSGKTGEDDRSLSLRGRRSGRICFRHHQPHVPHLLHDSPWIPVLEPVHGTR